jgi:hypothetical protein
MLPVIIISNRQMTHSAQPDLLRQRAWRKLLKNSPKPRS